LRFILILMSKGLLIAFEVTNCNRRELKKLSSIFFLPNFAIWFSDGCKLWRHGMNSIPSSTKVLYAGYRKFIMLQYEIILPAIFIASRTKISMVMPLKSRNCWIGWLRRCLESLSRGNNALSLGQNQLCNTFATNVHQRMLIFIYGFHVNIDIK